MAICSACEGPFRPFWPPSRSPATLKDPLRIGWYTLTDCSACGQLWTAYPCEPYLSFVYHVRWEPSVATWRAFAGQDGGLELAKWSEAVIKTTWQQLGPEDQAAIANHRARGFGCSPIDEEPIGSPIRGVPFDRVRAWQKLP